MNGQSISCKVVRTFYALMASVGLILMWVVVISHCNSSYAPNSPEIQQAAGILCFASVGYMVSVVYLGICLDTKLAEWEYVILHKGCTE